VPPDELLEHEFIVRESLRKPITGDSQNTSSVVVSRDFGPAMSRAKGTSPGRSYFVGAAAFGLTAEVCHAADAG
jgi:hypothetical protein